MKKIERLEMQQEKLQKQYEACTDPEQREDIQEQIDSIQDDIDEIMSDDFDPEDVYKIFGKQDSPSLNTALNY